MTRWSVGTQTVEAQAQPPQAPASMATMKGILTKVPVGVRTSFLESMFFVNGRLASVRIGEVKGALNKSDYLALLRNLGLTDDHENFCCFKAGDCIACQGHICNPQACTSGSHGVLLKNLLRKAPTAQQAQFLNSLDFKDGRLININTKGIEKHARREEMGLLPKK